MQRTMHARMAGALACGRCSLLALPPLLASFGPSVFAPAACLPFLCCSMRSSRACMLSCLAHHSCDHRCRRMRARRCLPRHSGRRQPRRRSEQRSRVHRDRNRCCNSSLFDFRRRFQQTQIDRVEKLHLFVTFKFETCSTAGRASVRQEIICACCCARACSLSCTLRPGPTLLAPE